MPATPRNPVEAQSVRYPTAADWWEALGSVPLNRIVFDPPPGSATEQDVLRLDDHEDRLCELIDGTLVEKTMGYEESALAMWIGHLLLAFVARGKLGVVTGADGMVRLLGRQVRIPDVAFVSTARLPGGKMPSEPIPDLAPDLAVEVLCDSNTPKEMGRKLQEYFAAGTRLVWYVDPRTRTVDVYESPDSCQRLNAGETLTGGEVLPGFSVRVEELFNVA